MSDASRCPQCGNLLPDDAPQGLCPKCLVQAGFESEIGPELSPGGSDPAVQPTMKSPADSGTGFQPPSPEELAPLFPQLEILGLIGKGGMGAVYKARQPGLDRLVAVKILPPEISRDPAFAERFQREARALAKLSHPHIVAVYDFGQTGSGIRENSGDAAEFSRIPLQTGLCYIVMEFVDGANLRQTIQTGTLRSAEALAIVPQICEALQFAHDEGIVHRDIKPENILIDKRGRVKIADFGLAKLLGADASDHSLTATHQVMGTLRYMAPEQMQGSREVDHRADIYSLGVVFYELLTGELPMGRFAPPSKRVQVDVRLDEIVLRALEQQPEQRYQHASELKSAVMSFSAVANRAPITPGDQHRDQNRRLMTQVHKLLDVTETRNRRLHHLVAVIGLVSLLIAFPMGLASMAKTLTGYRSLLLCTCALAALAGIGLMAYSSRIKRRLCWKVNYKGHAIVFDGGRAFAERLYLDDGLVRQGGFGVKMEIRTTIKAGDGIGDEIVVWYDARILSCRCRIEVEENSSGEKTGSGPVSLTAAAQKSALRDERTARAEPMGLPFEIAGSVHWGLFGEVHGKLRLGKNKLVVEFEVRSLFPAFRSGLKEVSIPFDDIESVNWDGWDLTLHTKTMKALAEIPKSSQGQVAFDLSFTDLDVPGGISEPVKHFLACLPRRLVAESAGVTHPSTRESPNEPRFSRFAIAGAVWALFGLLAIIPTLFFIGLNRVWNGTALPTDIIYEAPPLAFTIFMGTLLAIGAGAPIGTTIYGAIAIGHIKRSGGKIVGLPLSIIDVLLFPLLVIFAGIAVPVSLALHSLLPLQLIAVAVPSAMFALVVCLVIGFVVWRKLIPDSALASITLREKLRFAGIALLIAGIMDAVSGFVWIGHNVSVLVELLKQGTPIGWHVTSTCLSLSSLWIVYYVVGVALHLMTLEDDGDFTFCLLTAAIVPPGCLIGLPAAIYAMVQLGKPEVKALIPKKSSEPQPSTAPNEIQPSVENVASEPRLSRCAIAGAIWGGLGVFAAIFLLIAVSMTSREHVNQTTSETDAAIVPEAPRGGTPGWVWLIIVPISIVAASAPFGTTILGGVAIAHIKHFGGKIYGLPLAVADAIGFPLLLLDSLIVTLVASVVMAVLVAAFPKGPMEGALLSLPAALTLMIAIPLSAWIDFVIACRVWRAISKSISGDDELQTKSSAAVGVNPANDLGRISLGAAIAGVILPALLLLGGVVLSSRVSIPDGFVVACFLLGVGLQLVAIGCGIVSRRISSGKAGLIIGSISLVFWLATLWMIRTPDSMNDHHSEAMTEAVRLNEWLCWRSPNS